MMKFSLTANADEQEGFKFNFSADSIEETKVCKEIAEKLIEKISVIKIEIGGRHE